MDLKVGDYLKAVGSKPLPGGGSVTALAGALAANLLNKVCVLTSGRPEFAEYESQTREIWAGCRELSDDLTALMERDRESYQKVIDAYRLPGKTVEEKKVRGEVLEAAWKEAVETPSEIAEKSARIIGLSRRLIGRSNKTTIADISLAANLAYAAVEAAVIIIKDNLNKVRDRPYLARKLEWAEKLVVQAASEWEDIKLEINDFCACTL